MVHFVYKNTDPVHFTKRRDMVNQGTVIDWGELPICSQTSSEFFEFSFLDTLIYEYTHKPNKTSSKII